MSTTGTKSKLPKLSFCFFCVFTKLHVRVEAVMWKTGTFNLRADASQQEAMGSCDWTEKIFCLTIGLEICSYMAVCMYIFLGSHALSAVIKITNVRLQTSKIYPVWGKGQKCFKLTLLPCWWTTEKRSLKKHIFLLFPVWSDASDIGLVILHCL